VKQTILEMVVLYVRKSACESEGVYVCMLVVGVGMLVCLQTLSEQVKACEALRSRGQPLGQGYSFSGC
jgi:hypothetical protein